MLKKLSLRFSAAAIAALFVIELLMLGLINGLNFYHALKQSDDTLDTLIQNDGKLSYHNYDELMSREREEPPSQKPDSAPGDDDDDEDDLDDMEDAPPVKPEGDYGFEKKNGRFFDDKRADTEQKYIIRYFTAKINCDGDVTTLNTGHIATISSETAQSYALEVFEAEEERAFYNGMEFRYAVKKSSDGSALIVFYDFGTAAASAIMTAKLSAAIALGLLIVFSVIILLVSKRVVRPVVENYEKQRRFITDAGHELKTPLAIIRANTEVLEMTGGENEWTRSTINQADRLSELLAQMLMLAKSSESQRISFADVDISRMANEFADDFSILCMSKNKPLEADIADGATVFGDEKMLKMLISTLLENAVKYGMEDKPIEFKLTQSSKHVRFSVSNLCSDPPKGDTEHLFDRFYRGDSSRTRETGGSGIGLSIAKTVTDAHKGRISCVVEGERVTFKVKLPLSSADKKGRKHQPAEK